MVAPITDPDHENFHYDEFGLLHENCLEYDLDVEPLPRGQRITHTLADGRELSALLWVGTASESTEPVEPQVVYLHGGAQNAHTWDTVIMALRDIPAVCIDLPGHGLSQWRNDSRYSPVDMADDVAAMIDAVAPRAELVVGMSLGGLTASCLASIYPWLVHRLMIVDVTPGVDRKKAEDIHRFIDGPQTFDSFNELLQRTMEFNPTRSESSLRRGILHNAHRVADSKWQWRYDRTGLASGDQDAFSAVHASLWDHVGDVTSSFHLVQGALSPVVDNADIEKLLELQPDARVTVVHEAGHSIQGDQPLELAQLIREELAMER